MDRIRKIAESGAPLLSVAELERERLRAGYANRAITTLFVAVSLFVIAGIAIAVEDHPDRHRVDDGRRGSYMIAVGVSCTG